MLREQKRTIHSLTRLYRAWQRDIELQLDYYRDNHSKLDSFIRSFSYGFVYVRLLMILFIEIFCITLQEY